MSLKSPIPPSDSVTCAGAWRHIWRLVAPGRAEDARQSLRRCEQGSQQVHQPQRQSAAQQVQRTRQVTNWAEAPLVQSELFITYL